jgi:hypothetical protein
MKRVQIKVDYDQLLEMATAFTKVVPSPRIPEAPPIDARASIKYGRFTNGR